MRSSQPHREHGASDDHGWVRELPDDELRRKRLAFHDARAKAETYGHLYDDLIRAIDEELRRRDI